MQSLIALCNDAGSFPLNLDRRRPSEYHRRLRDQLNDHAERLFADEGQCALDLLELGHTDKGGFRDVAVHSAVNLSNLAQTLRLLV